MPETGQTRRPRTFLRYYGFSNIWTVGSFISVRRRVSGHRAEKRDAWGHRGEKRVIITDPVRLVLIYVICFQFKYFWRHHWIPALLCFFTTLQLSGRKLLFVSFSFAQRTLRLLRHIFCMFLFL